MSTAIEQLYTYFQQYRIISTDTRSIAPGSLFFALKGEHFNGNHFVAKALELGAAYAIVDEPEAIIDQRCLLVNDVLTNLQELARHHRRVMGKNGLRVFALTGSNGKTTTKELITRVVATTYHTLSTKGNLNNHIGVPLTLLRLDETHEIAIIEMGANHQKEIDQLCRIAEPDYGLITNIGLAHVEGFGGPEGVLKGKTELYRYLDEKQGLRFVLADEPRLSPYRRTDAILYGTTPDALIQGELLKADPFIRFRWKAPEQAYHEVQTQLPGSYNLPNLVAAIAVGITFKVPVEKIDAALADYIPDNNRSQLIQRGNLHLLLDAYNANPSSMQVAIENFALLSGSPKMIVLGDMFELGEVAHQEHQRIVDLIMQKLPDAIVILVGQFFSQTKDQMSFIRLPDSTAAAQWMKINRPQSGLVLIKGSRSMKMENVSEVLN